MNKEMELTQEQQDLLKQYPIYSQDGKGDQARVLLQIQATGTAWKWYVLEAGELPAESTQDGRPDIEYFGLTANERGAELGYFRHNELESLNQQGGLIHAEIERTAPDGETLGEVKATLRKQGYNL